MNRRRVLLLEPNYRNKYPPIGLMKLAMYHRLQGDDVVFYKGTFPDFILSELTCDAIAKFEELEQECPSTQCVNWRGLTPAIRMFIKKGKIDSDSALERALKNQPLARPWLESFRKQFRIGDYYKRPRWDRVCVTTLFTFHWDLTIETIEFAKKVCKDTKQVLVGGILASVIPDKVEARTGIKPHVGCMNVSKLPGDNPLPKPFGKTLIDELPLDYSILEEIDYRYPATDAYYSYATRGCVNKCAFCAVPKLEPEYLSYIPLEIRVKKTIERFGEQRHLLLLDNNAFASGNFEKIIDEICNSGFKKGATFIPPNNLDAAVNLLSSGWNDRAYIRLAVRLINTFVEKLDGERHDRVYGLLLDHGVLHDFTATKHGIQSVYEEIKDDYENARSKKPVRRYVDFNQGMDARLATPQNMAKLATVAIRPLRIAFDSWGDRKHYVRAVNLANDNGISHMSNYLLYNFCDRPVDLYRRLLLNIDLCMALGVNIYSFPMKYHPIMEEEWFHNRDYIGKHWTRKSIRTVQSVLNSTLGKIGRTRTFFFKAFGRDESEFEDLIRMPEAFIIKRWDAEICGYTDKWRNAYTALSDDERAIVNGIVDTNSFNKTMWKGQTTAVCNVLNFYVISEEKIPISNRNIVKRRISDFEETCPTSISEECKQLLNMVR